MKKQILLILLSFFLLSGCNNPVVPTPEGEEPTGEVTPPEEEGEGKGEEGQEDDPPLPLTPEVVESVYGEPYLSRQYYLNHIGDIYSVWKKYQGKGITIAVIDMGFDTTHEDFKDIKGNSRISDKSAYISYNGTISTQVGINYAHDLGDSHGTFCAGVAAAGLNHKGVIGIAPLAELMLIRVDKKPKSIAAAFKYAADNGAKVITISLGSYNYYTSGDLINDGSDLTTVFEDATNYCYSKGVVICSAAGNGGLENRPTEYTYPGAASHVIGCGGLAANSSGEIWTGSSYNYTSQYQFADVYAPADGMFNICNYTNKGVHYLYDGGWNGTSFSSPIVAGMAALYFEKYPSRTNVDFERDLYNSCHKITTSEIARSDQLGYGRVDVARLLNETSSETVTVKVTSSWSNTYLYAWNSDLSLNKELASWPGIKIDGSYQIKLSDYDSVIFNNGSNQKSLDLLASSFIDGATYKITSNMEQGCYLGEYIVS